MNCQAGCITCQNNELWIKYTAEICAIAPREDLAFAPIAISRSVDRDLMKQRGALRDHDRRRGHRIGACEAPRRRTQSSVNLGFVRVFWVCLFLVAFSKHQKIFFGNFFEIQPNTWKHFPFRKIAFPENGIFSGNAFIQTKHSLNENWKRHRQCDHHGIQWGQR